jgi:DNA-binding GntR family transcriptional regulator
LNERLVDQIRDRIALGALALGSRVSDKDLASEMQVSRTPVREALLQLQVEGLIVVRPRSGTFVFEPSADDLSQICEMRSLMEVGALRMALDADPAHLVRSLTVPVAEAALALERQDYIRCEELDTAFHETLIGLSGNRYLIESYRSISSKVRALRSRLAQNHLRIATAIAQHRRIIDLVVVGQPDAAVTEIASHVRNVRNQLAEPRRNLKH